MWCREKLGMKTYAKGVHLSDGTLLNESNKDQYIGIENAHESGWYYDPNIGNHLTWDRAR